jgi:peptidoglycan/LPS O-acetylase OafA/YrhL
MYYAYLANYQIFADHQWPHLTSHIWTLAIEEQFYLIWPLIIIFLPHRHLIKVFLLIVIGSVAGRAIFYYPTGGIPQVILTQYSIDAFAIGGLLAYKASAADGEKQLIDQLFSYILYVAVPLAVFIIIIKSYYLSFVANGLIFSMLSFKIIEAAAVGFKGGLGRFLENKTVLFIGKISYGIYLYHLMVPIVFWKLFNIAYIRLMQHSPGFFGTHQKAIAIVVKILASVPVSFVIYAGCTIILAQLSSKLIEKPFGLLKKYLNYEKSPARVKT